MSFGGWSANRCSVKEEVRRLVEGVEEDEVEEGLEG